MFSPHEPSRQVLERHLVLSRLLKTIGTKEGARNEQRDDCASEEK